MGTRKRRAQSNRTARPVRERIRKPKEGDRVIIFDFGERIPGTVHHAEKNLYWVFGDNGVKYPSVTLGKPKRIAYFYIESLITEE